MAMEYSAVHIDLQTNDVVDKSDANVNNSLAPERSTQNLSSLRKFSSIEENDITDRTTCTGFSLRKVENINTDVGKVRCRKPEFTQTILRNGH